MLDCEPKLKRGLSDISPLFSPLKDGRRGEPGAYIKVLSVCDLSEADSRRMNNYAAEILAKKNHSCAVISLSQERNQNEPAFFCKDARFLHLPLEMEELSRIAGRSVEPRFIGEELRQVLLLAPDYSQTQKFPLFFELLDQFILVVDPTEESLREAYKLIKGTRILNNRLQYFLVFRGDRYDLTGVFERFSEILMNRLRIDINWIGYLTQEVGENPLEKIKFENLFLNIPARLEMPGKMALADFSFRAMRAENRIL